MVVTVATYNTIQLMLGTVYTLVTPYAGPYYYNVLNLGAATVYIRADQDPAEGDPLSETLPAHHADNLILVPEGTEGLRFLAGLPILEGGEPDDRAVITLRLVRG